MTSDWLLMKYLVVSFGAVKAVKAVLVPCTVCSFSSPGLSSSAQVCYMGLLNDMYLAWE